MKLSNSNPAPNPRRLCIVVAEKGVSIPLLESSTSTVGE
jgi:hypothetical protein